MMMSQKRRKERKRSNRREKNLTIFILSSNGLSICRTKKFTSYGFNRRRYPLYVDLN